MESLARWSRQKSRGGRRRTARRRRARGRARSPASSPLRGPYDRRVAASLTVVGSINLDLVVRVDRLPRPGETLSGATLERIPGGKGANQAVAAARLGAGVRMVGCIGGDSYGEEALVGLRDAGIELDVSEVDAPTGIAIILVAAGGDNQIVVVPGRGAGRVALRRTAVAADRRRGRRDTPRLMRTPVLVDCDPGHDDAIALLLALASPELELLGVTTVAGNQTLDKTTANAIRLLEFMARTEIPVAAGADRPLVREQYVAAYVHGETGMDGPDLPAAKGAPLDRHAVDFLAD